MKKCLALSMLLLSVISCGNKSSGGSSNEAASIPEPIVVEQVQDYTISKARVVNIKDDLSNFEEFKLAMNQFKLIFKTKKGHNKHQVAKCTINHKEYSANFDHEGQTAEIVFDIDKAQNDFVGADCQVGNWTQRQFLVYKTVYVSGTKRLEDLPHLNPYTSPENRIFSLVLDEGATLIVDDYYSLDYELNEVISKNATIKSVTKKKGYLSHGGLVKIKTAKILGKLEITLFGSAGSYTRNDVFDEIYEQGGNSGSIQLEATKSNDFQLHASIEAGAGTNADKNGALGNITVILYDREFFHFSSAPDSKWDTKDYVNIY